MSGLRDPLEFAPNPPGLQSPIPGLVPPTTGNQGNQPVPEPPLSNRDNAPDSARQPTNNEKENAAIEEEREKVQKVHQKRKEFIAKLLVYKRPGIITESERKDYEATYMIKTTNFLGFKAQEADKSLLGSNHHLKPGGGQPINNSSGGNIGQKNEFLELDGIFLTSADKEVNSDNVRRLEQRLVNSGQAQYFREDNGQLIMDNKLFEAKHFRRTDISLMKNNFHSFIKRNAVICERLNQKKKTYYQMEVFVGKLYIENTSLFEEEDRLAAKLKRQMRLYREKVDKSLIPHYGQVLEEQSLAFDRLQEDPNHKVGDLALISKQMVDTQAKLNTEKSELDQIMRETYANWKSIKDVRARQGYVSTPVELVVQQYVSDQDKEEQYLVLRSIMINEKVGVNGRAIPSKELARREKIKKQTYFLKIYINNELLATTPKVAISWPDFEVDFKELLNVFIFTKPYSISIEICQGGFFSTVLDRIEISIPGEHANSLTSASTIYRTVEYQKKNIKNLPKKDQKSKANVPKNLPKGEKDASNSNPVDDHPSDLVIPAQAGEKPSNETNKEKKEEENHSDIPDDETLDLENKIVEVVESGRLNLEVGWIGCGPRLPPLNSGGFGIFRLKKQEKHGYQALSQTDDDDEVLIDVNDPRSNDQVEKVREIRNNELRSLLTNDMKVPLFDVKSMRHEILKLSLMDYTSTIKKLSTSMLEVDVAHSEEHRKVLEAHYNEISNLMRENHTYSAGDVDMNNITKIESFPYSIEASKRISETKQTFLKKQAEIKSKKHTGMADIASLAATIDEFRFGDEENNIIQKLLKIFEPRRKLKLPVTKPKKEDAREHSECVVSVQAIKGLNVPAREKDTSRPQALAFIAEGGNDMIDPPILSNDKELHNATENALIHSEKYDFPSSFLQMTIVDPDRRRKLEQETNDAKRKKEESWISTVAGETFDGVDPEWNQNMQLKYSNYEEIKFTNQQLIECQANLFLTLFDKFGSVEQLGQLKQSKFDERESKLGDKGTYEVQIDSKFLGNIKIPLSSLFLNPKIDSMFRVNRPIFMSGYISSKQSIFMEANDFDINFVDPYLPTYLMLSISIEPNFELPDNNNTDYYPGAEPAQFLLAGKAFLEAIFKDKENKGRNIRLWGSDMKGQSVFIPRYITPQEPPADFFTVDAFVDGNVIESKAPEGPGKIQIDYELYQKCARYVALIPVKNESSFFRDMPDIFMSSQEFLDMRAGDYEEHAILLCNYFLFIDKKHNLDHVETMVIMGRGVPEGKTYYVLRRDTKADSNEIWNPVTGEVYVFHHRVLTTKFLCFKFNTGVTVESGSRFLSGSHGLYLSPEVCGLSRHQRQRLHQHTERQERRKYKLGHSEQEIFQTFSEVRDSDEANSRWRSSSQEERSKQSNVRSYTKSPILSTSSVWRRKSKPTLLTESKTIGFLKARR